MRGKSTIKLGMSVLASFVLAACGSSGGGSSAPQHDAPVPHQPEMAKPANPAPSQPEVVKPTAPSSNNPTAPQVKPSEPSIQPAQPEKKAEQPASVEKPNKNERIQESDKRVISGYRLPTGNLPLPFTLFEPNNDITQVEIDGKTIALLKQPSELATSREGRDLVKLEGAAGENTRWAWIVPKTQEIGYLLTVGKNATAKADMPKGYANYHGMGVHLTHEGKAAPTLVQFEVDFDNKLLNGNISPMPGQENLLPNQSPIELNAHISGNTFEGEQNGTQTSGGFYGEKASELLGTYSHFVFDEDHYYLGAFAAKTRK